MRSVQITCGPKDTVGNYEVDLSGCCLMFLVLAITGTCTAKLQYQAAPGVWLNVGGFGSTSSTVSAAQSTALGVIRLVVESVSPGGAATLEVSGVKG